MSQAASCVLADKPSRWVNASLVIIGCLYFFESVFSVSKGPKIDFALFPLS